MIDRRGFVAAGVAALVAPRLASAQAANPVSAGRPPIGTRAFTSPAIEQAIANLRRQLGTVGLRAKFARMAGQCLPNTLDTTVELGTLDGRADTFVITGDIHAMWLRDSTAQVWPYLPFARQDPRLALLLRGVIGRQVRCVLIDPYANAFNRDLVPSPEHADDDTVMKPGVFERKWELDSLCSVIRLSYGYWRATGDTSPFDSQWREAMTLIIATMRTQQRKDGAGPYRFQRTTAWNPDSVPGNGYGNPVRPVGLIVSLFRPSDDATIFPFLVPANMYAVVALRQLAVMLRAFAIDAAATQARALADEVNAALRIHALRRSGQGDTWAYEVDGFGNSLFMDDANVPSLLSLPYLGWCGAADPTYQRTRKRILSDDNPWFRRGRAAAGVGSPHTPGNRVWPIAIIMRALTSTSDLEVADCLRMLATTDAGTGFMHEAFHVDDPNQFSRPWFAWANSLFGELMLTVASQRPRALNLLS